MNITNLFPSSCLGLFVSRCSGIGPMIRQACLALELLHTHAAQLAVLFITAEQKLSQYEGISILTKSTNLIPIKYSTTPVTTQVDVFRIRQQI